MRKKLFLWHGFLGFCFFQHFSALIQNHTYKMLLTDTMKQLKFYWTAGGKATKTEDHFVDMSRDFEIKKN